MGVTYGDLKNKFKAMPKEMIVEKKVKNKKIINKKFIKRTPTINTPSELIQKFKDNNIISVKLAKSKTYKEKESQKKSGKNECGHNFSDNINQEEMCPQSLETNFSSNNSNNEIVNKLSAEDNCNELDYNNIDEDDNENEGNEDNVNKEDKLNEYKITSNIKTVFVDAKMQGKEHNENIENNNNVDKNNEINENNNNIGLAPSVTFDYELNFYRSGNEIRQSYISKLIIKKVWNPSMKPKRHNSIIIYDWDDTLLPTSFLTPNGFLIENMELSEEDQEKLLKIENCVFSLLTESIEKGNVYIITNAGNGWVEYSAMRFYPSIISLLPKIKIISARTEYEKLYPGDSRQWKIHAFLTVLNNMDVKLVTNIICLGDSLFEIEAGRILASKFTEAFIKTIKFREAPKLDELIKQLKLVSLQFGKIYSTIKNLTIRVEKKKKEEN